MSIFTKIANAAAPKLVRLKAAAPHIAVVAGIGIIVGGTVYACIQTAKLKDDPKFKELCEIKKILEEAEEKLKNNELPEGTPITIEQIKADRRKANREAAKIILKKYILAFAIVVIGATVIGVSHKMMITQKNAALAFGNAAMAAYNGLAARVEQELPPEQAAKLIFGKDACVTVDGQQKAVFPDQAENLDLLPWCDKYDIIFDAASRLWTPSPRENANRVKSVISSMVNTLEFVGHLFFYEAYQMFGYTKAEAIEIFGPDAGWVRDLPDGTTGTINYAAIIDASEVQTQEFLNGHEPNVVLHLRPHGMVSDLLKRTKKAKRTGHWEAPFEYRGVGVTV